MGEEMEDKVVRRRREGGGGDRGEGVTDRDGRREGDGDRRGGREQVKTRGLNRLWETVMGERADREVMRVERGIIYLEVRRDYRPETGMRDGNGRGIGEKDWRRGWEGDGRRGWERGMRKWDGRVGWKRSDKWGCLA